LAAGTTTSRVRYLNSCSAHDRLRAAAFEDYVARIALASTSHANGVGVSVRADETALLELIEGGLVHESLVEEPRAA
jgi:hypothetical protein